MHITLEADYALRIVECLAISGRRMDAKSISRQTCVTLRFALKILRKLVANGIVKSFKGAQGGYELTGKPGDISLKDVIETVEGKYYLSRCLSDDYSCSRNMKSCCKFRKAFDSISSEVEKRLDSYTFDMFTDT